MQSSGLGCPSQSGPPGGASLRHSLLRTSFPDFVLQNLVDREQRSVFRSSRTQQQGTKKNGRWNQRLTQLNHWCLKHL